MRMFFFLLVYILLLWCTINRTCTMGYDYAPTYELRLGRGKKADCGGAAWKQQRTDRRLKQSSARIGA